MYRIGILTSGQKMREESKSKGKEEKENEIKEKLDAKEKEKEKREEPEEENIDIEGEEDWNSKGIRLSFAGKYNEAILCFDKAIERKPDDRTAWFNKGNVLYNLGRYDEAILCFDRVIEINPNDDSSYRCRGLCYYRKGLYDKAIEDLTEAIKLQPKVDYLYYERGWIYYEKGLYNKAIKDFNKTIQLCQSKKRHSVWESIWYIGSHYPGYDYDEAIEGLSKIIELDPKNAHFYYYLRAYYYYSKDLYDKAIEDITETIKLKPKSSYLYYMRSLIYYKKGSYDKSVEDITRAIKLNPKQVRLYYKRGWLYFEMGLYHKAIEDFNKTLELYPEGAYSYWPGWGYGFYDEGDPEKYVNRAIEDFSKAIELDPKNAYFYYWRGRAYCQKTFEEKDSTRLLYERAIEDFTRAIELDPSCENFYYWRGIAYHKIGFYDEAIEDFSEAIKLKPNVDDLYAECAISYEERGWSYYKKGLYDKAIEDFTKAIKLGEGIYYYGKSFCYYGRGLCYYRKGLYDEAINDFTKALECAKYPHFYFLCFLAYHKKGLYDKAYEKVIDCFSEYEVVNYFSNANELPENLEEELKPEDYAFFYYFCGLVLYNGGLYDKSTEKFTKAIELKPNEAYFYYWRGVAYLKEGSYDKAIQDFTQSIKLKLDCADFYAWRGLAYFEKRDYDRAIEDFTYAINLNPNYADFYFLRARTYCEKGEHDKAIKDFTEAIELKPDDADFYHWRGLAYFLKGECDKAIENFTEAIRLKPNVDSYYCRGLAYIKKGLYDQSIRDFDKVLEINPSHEKAWKAKEEVESLIESRKKSLIKSGNGRKSFKVSFLLMLFLTSVPMLVILDKKDDWQQRFIETIKENQKKIRISQLPDNLSSLDEVIDYVIYQLPDHKIKGAALPRDTNAHFIIALVSGILWIIFLSAAFSSSSNGESRAILSSLFTAILGILILLAIQFIALELYKRGLRETLRLRIFGIILYFIGFSYYGALDPESGFIKSFVGFTCGVGLCEELVKLIPVIWLMKRAFKKGETLHLSEILLVGLASGVGFGVAEGIMYSAQFYNGIYGWDVYWVRFVTCVALHSTWTGIAVIMLWPHRNELFKVEETTKNEKAKDEKKKEDKEKGKSHISWEEQAVEGIFMLAFFSGVAIILHGLYDTFLKKGEDFWALIVAITTFVVFYYLLNERYKKESQI